MASGIVEPSSQDSQGSGSEQAAGAVSRHTKLVERLLNASSALPAFIHDLLTTQAIVVAATEAAAFLLDKSDESGLRPVSHIRPENADPQTRTAAMNAFKQIVTACVAQGRDGAIEINANESDPGAITPAEPQFCLITILRQDGNPVAVSAVITRCLNAERARQRLIAMQIVAGYFELYSLKRNAEQAQIVAQSHQHVLQLATAVATAQGFEAAAMSLCNELASRTKAVRVTLGWIKNEIVKVVAFSHTEQFDKKQELVVELQKVMEECVDQDEPVHYVPAVTASGPEGKDTPAIGSANVTRAASQFSRTQGGNAVLSLPLRRHSEIVGVIVLEFAPNAQLAPHAMASLTVAVDLLAPQLYDRYQNDRWLITKAGLSIRALAEAAVGPQHMLAKIISSTVLLVLIFVCVVKVEYHVTAPFQFAPVSKTTVTAPFDGNIAEVDVRPGSTMIKKGQVLLKFKTEEYDRKYQAAHSEALSYKAEADAAQEAARFDPAKMGDYAIASQRQAQAQAEADLDQYYINEATVVAPADGIVLTGDLEDKVNSFVKQGDELFTFQSTDQLRAELSVAENDIQEVVAFGKDGQLATTSLPSEKFPFTIERIPQMAQPKEGANIYKVYATLTITRPEWRPGMEGEAKINIQKRTIVWVWTHKFADWLRLKSWTWM